MNLISRMVGNAVSRGVRNTSTNPMVEFADLRVHSAGITPNLSDPHEIRYLEYRLSVREYGDPYWTPKAKAVRFLRITRMPVTDPTKRKRSNEYDDQRDLVRALWMQRIHYVCVLGDSGSDGHGVLHLMGVQGVGEDLDDARANADRHYAALASQLTGTYPQIRYRPLTPPEAEWLLHKQQQWSHVLPIRGIPMPRRDVGQDLNVPIAGTTATGGEFDEGIEELIRGLLGGPGYLLVLMASPVTLDQVTARLSAAADQLSTVASQVHGQRSISAGVGLPMMFSTAIGDAQGTGHSFGVNDGTSDALAATHGVSHTSTDGVSAALTQTHGVTESHGVGVTDTAGNNHGFTHNEGLSGGQSDTQGVSTQQTQGITHGVSTGESDAISQTQSQSLGQTHQVSQGVNGSTTATASDANTIGASDTHGENSSHTAGGSESRGQNWSEGTNQQVGSSMGATHGENSSRSAGISFIGSLHTSSATSDQLSYQANQSFGTTTNLGGSQGVTASESMGQGVTDTHGVNAAHTSGLSQSASEGWNTGVSDGVSQQVGSSAGRTHGITTGQSLSGTDSSAVGQNANVGTNRGWNEGVAANVGTQQSTALSRTESVANQQQVANQVGQSRSLADGTSDSLGHTLGDTYGRSDALSQSFARNSQVAGSLSFVPTLGMGASRQTIDAMAEQVSKILTAQVHRLSLAHEEGMWLSQGYMLVPDDHTAAAAAGLLTSSFWAPGQKAPVPQPFCVSSTLTRDQCEHLVEHARAFSPCAHPDLRPQVIEPHFYATALLSNEVAVLTTPPRIDVPGILAAAATRLPTLVFPKARDAQIHLGHVVDTQRAVVSTERFSLEVDDDHNGMLHPLITGSTGRGKTETGLRLAYEWLHSTQTIPAIDPGSGLLRPRQIPRGVLALDRKSDWRRLMHCLPPEQTHRFRFFDLSRERPKGYRPPPGIPDPYLRYNLLRIPRGVEPNVYRDAICDTMAKVGSLGPRGRGIIWQALNSLWSASRPDPARGDSATVYERPELSRFVGMADLADWVDQHLESISKKSTTSKELVTGYNVIQNRMQFFKRGVYGSGIYLPDPPGSTTGDTIEISDLIGGGDCVVLEAAHLDAQMGAFVLAAVFTAVFAFARDNPGQLTETLVVLEEANDYLPNERDQDVSGVTQTVFDQTISMGRALKLSLMQLVQSPERLSQQAINCAGLVVVHSADSYESKQRVMAKLGKDGRYDHRDLSQFLSEIPTGWAIVKPRPTQDWIDGAPVLIAVDAVDFPRPSDAELGLAS